MNYDDFIKQRLEEYFGDKKKARAVISIIEQADKDFVRMKEAKPARQGCVKVHDKDREFSIPKHLRAKGDKRQYQNGAAPLTFSQRQWVQNISDWKNDPEAFLRKIKENAA